jgi:hypothetical protein
VTTAEGWPRNDSGWMHMLATTHSNDANYFSMQIASDFYSNDIYYRSVNNNGATGWSRFALYNNAFSGELRATIFRDNDNTAFLIDPAGTSVINTANTSRINLASSNGVAAVGDGSGWTFTGSGYVYLAQGGPTYTQTRLVARDGIGNDTAAGLTLHGGTSGFTQINGNARSPSFTDSDDTSRYLDPNGTSQLVGTTIITRSGNSNDTFGGLEMRENNLQGVGTGAASEAPGINFHWAARAAARIYMDSGGNFVIGGQSDITNNRRSLSINELFAAGEVRGTLFRDSNNTGFFADPASTSVFSIVRASILQHSNGNTALTLNDTYFRLHDPQGRVAAYLGGTGDQNNYYDNTNHYFRDASANLRISFSSGGDIVAQGNITAYGSPSDINLKENIENIPNALEKLLTLNGVNFNYKKDGSRSTGVIAQEVEKVLPEVIYEATNPEQTETFKAVRYGNMVGLLIEAIKEQQTHINNLQEQINSLKEDK